MAFTSSSLRAQRSNPEKEPQMDTDKHGLPRRAFALLAMTIALGACKAETPQASHQMCQFTFDAFEENMIKAKEATGVDKLYYAQMGHMNIDVLLETGCCKYEDTCPVLITE